jgi:hypothetical protein
MIEREYGTFHLCCDFCGEEPDEIFDEFQDAVNYKKNHDWESRKIKGTWFDVCPDCTDKG